MNKNIKTITKIMMIVIIAIAILLTLPKTEKAYNPTINGISLDSLKNGDTVYISNYNELTDRHVFCIERGQEVSGFMKLTYRFNISYDSVEKISGGNTVKSNDKYVVRFAKGLAYIVSKSDEDGYDTEVQEALWAYLIKNVKSTDNNIKTACEFFGIKDQHTDISVNDSGRYIYNSATGVSHHKAYEIYSEAMQIRNGEKDCIVDAILYKLEGVDTDWPQEILIVERAEITEVPPVTINFKKQDFSGNNLGNAKIEIEKGDNVNIIEGNTTLTSSAADGSFGSITVYPLENTGKFELNIKETTVPTGYKGVTGTINLIVEYDKTTGNVIKITSNKTEYVPNNTENNNVIIKNKPQIEKLTLIKESYLNNTSLAGATFRITLTNIESIGNYSTGGTKSGKIILTGIKTGSDGRLVIEDLVIEDPSKEVTITIEETAVPQTNGEYEYKKIDGKITIKLKRKGSDYTYSVDKDSTITDKEYDKNLTFNKAKHEISLTIKNVPIISLSGIVWEDGQIGEKAINDINGKKDNGERGLSGVLVGLYSVKDGKIIKSVKTNNAGQYEFKDIEKTNEGYRVVFSYDGINYQETKSLGAEGTDSKANENETTRKEFNDKFKTISKDKSNSNIKLSYEYDEGNRTSKLKVNMDGTNPANGKATDFQMKAQTGVYKNKTSNINCGLAKKEVDLAIGTDVSSARLTINGKETTYSYAQIINGEMADLDLDEILQNKSSDTQNVIYNLYLYKSDYNYRITDYKTGENAITNIVNTEDDDVNNYDEQNELEAYITYTVMLKNQTHHQAQVDEFAYYYDEIFEPYNIVSTDDYTVSIDENQRKITFTSNGDGLSVSSPDYRKQIDLTFRVKKGEDGKIELKENCTNVAEITRYTTEEGGLIDRDSAPENGITNGVISQYEDDTDQAKGITISLRDDERKITGTVWDDGEFNSADGVKSDSENGVNDVIVQLVEIKKINGQYYEYIWQETRSGSGTVKKLSSNGNSITEQNYRQATNDGSYEFTGYIPGNYIVRFIYGDGSTYDLTDNVKTYNGQDYKSTTDSKYQASWYNTAGYEEGQSVARDNEARRLEVMAYSSVINKEIGTALENRSVDDLKNTWMAAETSRINVPIDADNKATDSNNTGIAYESIGNENIVSFGNINFGLALRPETKIVIEKHITGLKITPNGTGVQPIVDARANIEYMINESEVSIGGVTQGLAIVKSTRDNRGFWQVATDIEELAQGASLEVEYTYVIKNDGDKDYLSKTLIDAYENQDTKPYAETLNEIKNTVKGTMRNGTYSYGNTNIIGNYLGQYYYNGQVASTDAEVTSRVEALQEALNNDLKFDEETSGTDFKKINQETVAKKVYDTNGAEQIKDIETIVEIEKASEFLTTKSEEKYTQGKDIDYSKTITLRCALSSTTGGEIGANLPSYIAEVVKYSNAAGRRDMNAEPENLSYVHSDDTEMTMENSNELDEFWGETIIITKPTGEDKLSPMQIAIITISSIAVIGLGIVLIRRFVLKK